MQKEGFRSFIRDPEQNMEKFRECAILKNGETLHITRDAEMVDGSHWGVTTVDGTEGWVDLEKTEEWKKEHPDTVRRVWMRWQK